MKRPGYQAAQMTMTQSFDVKPKTRPAGKLSVMRVSELCVGTTHKGRYLSGKVAEHPFFMVSASFVLEDLFGDYVEVAVYNVGEEAAMHLFCKGRFLSIAEPYYKIRADGTDGIRVDDPADLEEAELPKSMGGWREIGNDFFKSSKVQDAIHCYESGLAREEMRLAGLLFSNRALCKAKAKEWALALRFASLAAQLDAQNVKAKYRQAEALCHLSPASGALLVRQGLKKWPEFDSLRHFQGSNPSDSADPEDWALLPEVVSPSQGLATQKASPQKGGKTPGKLAFLERAKAAELFRSRAAEAFKAGDHDKADAIYAQALQLVASELEEAALLFSNLSACHLSGSGLRKALAAASTAALLAPGMAKAWVRRAKAMERLGLSQAASSLDGIDDPEVRAEANALRKRPLHLFIAFFRKLFLTRGRRSSSFKRSI